MQTYEIFEIIMLLCFGVSWPISVYKSIKSKSTKGKSPVFIVAIIIGYISGITGKIVKWQMTGDPITYVMIFYCLNLVVVSIDLAIYFYNAKREKEMEAGK